MTNQAHVWMVVEDEPDVYEVIMAMLDMWGVEGLTFTDGTAALEWIDHVNQGLNESPLPALAILDIRLPTYSGPEIGAALRQSPFLSNIGIVLITAYHLSPNEEQEVIQYAQADRLMYKPLPGVEELRDILEQIIYERHNG